MATLSIKYTGSNQYFDDNNNHIIVTNPKEKLKYKYVILSYGKKNKKLFKSGNFVKDWYDAIKFIVQNQISPVANTSDVDQFIRDGAKFDSAYLHIKQKPTLYYIDRTQENWYLSDIDDGIEFFVEEGTTPTWEELKIICGDIKK